MSCRITRFALIYLRRSNSRNELSLAGQLDWALREAAQRGLTVDVSQADLSYMIAHRLTVFKSLYIDDGISGAEFQRPGFQALLREVEKNRNISFVLAHRRDRLARPVDAMEMAKIERDIRFLGVTFIFSDRVAGPLDPSAPVLAEEIALMVEYYQNGDELRKIAERVLNAQRLLALEGFSTGGNPPYGHVRVLVDGAGNIIEELPPGKKVRQAGCHVRWAPKDQDKITIWILILNLKHAGWGAKRIAQHLNNLGIPSPGAGQLRTDNGVVHRVTGKWGARTVLELCRNRAILGIKEYGVQSEGWHRRFDGDRHRTLTDQDRNPSKKPKVIRNDSTKVFRVLTGESLYSEQKFEEVQQTTDARGISQRGIPRASDPSRYPLSCRVVDLFAGCGAIMYGHQVGQRRLYKCGRYLRTAGDECENNAVDAEALLRFTLLTLRQCIDRVGGQGELRRLFEQRAKSQASQPQENAANQEMEILGRRIERLRYDHEAVGQNMARERDPDRYQMIAGEFDRIATEIKLAEERVNVLKCRAQPMATAQEEVDAAMALLSDILRVTENAGAREAIRPIVEKLNLWIGLDFAEAIKGKKRKTRRLVGGIMAIGQQSPLLLHGKNRTDNEAKSSRSEQHFGLSDDSFVNRHYGDSNDLVSSAGGSELIPCHLEGISFTKGNRGEQI